MANRILPGVDVARAEWQLGLIGEIGGMAAELDIPVWLRGGWAVDFFLGEVTRDHVDIDWFAWAGDAVTLEDWLLGQGYQPVGSAPAEQQLDVVRDGQELSFAWLAKDGSQVLVAGGPWAGQPWPSGMLDAAPGRIDQLTCPIVEPAVQIEIKQMTPVWVPGRPRRTKDAQDIARLQTALLRRDAEPT